MHDNTEEGAEKHLSLAKRKPQPMGEDDCEASAVHVSLLQAGMSGLSWATWSSYTHISSSAHTGAATAQGLGCSGCAGLAARMLLLPPSDSPQCQ